MNDINKPVRGEITYCVPLPKDFHKNPDRLVPQYTSCHYKRIHVLAALSIVLSLISVACLAISVYCAYSAQC